MRQPNRFENEKGKNGVLPGLFLLLILFPFGSVLSKRFVSHRFVLGFLISVAVLVVLGFFIGMKFRKNRDRDDFESCSNPEPHRHFESVKPCPNPEPHGHSSGVPQPVTQFEQDEAARKKRLENMRILFEAGILTREEYEIEVRRLKSI